MGSAVCTGGQEAACQPGPAAALEDADDAGFDIAVGPVRPLRTRTQTQAMRIHDTNSTLQTYRHTIHIHTQYTYTHMHR